MSFFFFFWSLNQRTVMYFFWPFCICKSIFSSGGCSLEWLNWRILRRQELVHSQWFLCGYKNSYSDLQRKDPLKHLFKTRVTVSLEHWHRSDNQLYIFTSKETKRFSEHNATGTAEEMKYRPIKPGHTHHPQVWGWFTLVWGRILQLWKVFMAPLTPLFPLSVCEE